MEAGSIYNYHWALNGQLTDESTCYVLFISHWSHLFCIWFSLTSKFRNY